MLKSKDDFSKGFCRVSNFLQRRKIYNSDLWIMLCYALIKPGKKIFLYWYGRYVLIESFNLKKKNLESWKQLFTKKIIAGLPGFQLCQRA